MISYTRQYIIRQYWGRCRRIVARAEESGQINSGDAGAYSTEEIRGNGSDAASDAICRENVIAVGAIDGGDVTERGVGDIGNVDHGDVHGDDADNGSENATD
jgi:hypothetical protein